MSANHRLTRFVWVEAGGMVLRTCSRTEVPVLAGAMLVERADPVNGQVRRQGRNELMLATLAGVLAHFLLHNTSSAVCPLLFGAVRPPGTFGE